MLPPLLLFIFWVDKTDKKQTYIVFVYLFLKRINADCCIFTVLDNVFSWCLTWASSLSELWANLVTSLLLIQNITRFVKTTVIKITPPQPSNSKYVNSIAHWVSLWPALSDFPQPLIRERRGWKGRESLKVCLTYHTTLGNF